VRGELHFDVVVVGAGTAGLVAGIRLAQKGARVCVLAKGIGSTPLAPATIDVLGYAPADEPSRAPAPVDDPGRALRELVRERPGHPYALIGSAAVGEALGWFSELVAAGPLPGYRYRGGVERNFRLPTALGALRPSALVPETMAGGNAASLERVCIVGTRALRDFHPRLCAENLRLAGIDARWLSLPLELERPDTSTQGIARHFDDGAWRARFCAQLSPRLRAGEPVGLPAMVGLSDPHAAWSDLERRLGRPAFEIPGLPPSVPGLRLLAILRSALRAAGGRLVLGAEVIGAQRDGARVSGLLSAAAGHPRCYRADAFVLATGGVASGAIELDSHWRTRERILDLPLHGVPPAGELRFVPEYLTEQPIARVGVAVDDQLRAAGCENVHVIGAALAGAVPWRELSGEGIALASGWRVAELLAGSARADGVAQAEAALP
jgi:glycerol-3-phosphate dehydrogenase subunit B